MLRLSLGNGPPVTVTLPSPMIAASASCDRAGVGRKGECRRRAHGERRRRAQRERPAGRASHNRESLDGRARRIRIEERLPAISPLGVAVDRNGTGDRRQRAVERDRPVLRARVKTRDRDRQIARLSGRDGEDDLVGAGLEIGIGGEYRRPQ